MNIYDKLKNLDLPGNTKINLTLSEGTDVFVHNETEVETALSDTDVVSEFADFIATPGLHVQTQYGTPVLDSLRDAELLDDYERGSECFSEYLAETINENFYDVDLIDYSTEKYDHKRGFCTLTADVQVELDNFISAAPYVGSSWTVSVRTPSGTLTLD